MKEFEELQLIWKSSVKEKKDNNLNQVPGKILEKLKKLEGFQHRINMIKILSVSVILSLLIIIPSVTGIKSITVYFGLGIIILSTVLFMLVYFKNQFNIRKLDFTAEAKDFTDQTLNSLKKQNNLFRLPFLIFILAMIAGSNVLLIGLKGSSAGKLSDILKSTALIALFSFIGYFIRLRRIKKEITPIMDELINLKESLTREAD